MNDRVNLRTPFDTQYFREYYKGYRNKYEDLFASERKFMPDFVAAGKSYLDIGCAVGGMLEIMSSVNADIRYTGVDISPEMIEMAKQNYPQGNFLAYDGLKLPFDDSSFDRVITLGTTVHDPEFEKLLSESYRVAREALFFDIRLTETLPTLKSVDKAYVDDGSGVRYHYVVENWADFQTWIRSLAPSAKRVDGYGYWGTANNETTLPAGYEKICMSTFVIYKSDTAAKADANAKPQYHLELPWMTERKTEK